MKRLARPLAVSVLALATMLVFAAPASAATIIVHPGESIQAAIDAANPGDTIQVRPGTYAENIQITTDGLRLIGNSARIVLPDNPTPNFCGDETFVIGVCIVGNPIQGVSITGFTINGFFMGLFLFDGVDVAIANNVASDNDEYGFFANNSTGTKLSDNVARNSSEAGIYVGDSPNSDATVSGNDLSGNQEGIFVRSAENATIVNNHLHDNCQGILFLGDNPGPSGASSVTGNIIDHNTKACPGSDENPPLSGIGVAIASGHDVRIESNVITRNVPSGETIASGGVVVLAFGPTAPSGNLVRFNSFRGNSPDIFWDGTGSHNVFTRNVCSTSVPAGLCA